MNRLLSKLGIALVALTVSADAFAAGKLISMQSARALRWNRVDELYGPREQGDPSITFKVRFQNGASKAADPKFTGVVKYSTGSSQKIAGTVDRTPGLSFQQAVTVGNVQ